jgi:NADH dehydrogenase [ubiquinone] 1 alpha subcomplex assembly factor 1
VFVKTILLLLATLSFAQAATPLVRFDSLENAGFWSPVTDAVRGGASTIAMTIDTQNQRSLITGFLRLNAEGAGFASYRVENADRRVWRLENNAGIGIEVVGDGREYTLLIEDIYSVDSERPNYNWQVKFPTTAGQKKSFTFPWGSFKAISRGREISPPRPLDLSSVKQIGIQINDKKNGPFRLELLRLEAQ